jgi:hypothetical protein
MLSLPFFQVFSLGNLKEMLVEVEESLTARPNGSYPVTAMHSSNYSLADVTSNPLEMNPQLRLQAAALKAIADLEGQDAKYSPLFGTDTKIKVR